MEDRKIQPIKIGILGGGQLARMLLLKSHEMGLNVFVLSSNKTDPAAQVTSQWIQGNPFEYSDLKSFFKTVDLVTFESEFVDADLISKASQDLNVKFSPSLDILKVLQNRKTQKACFKKYGLDTAPFMELDISLSFEAICKNLNSGSFVIKKCFGGYDGYGTWVIRNDSQWDKFLKSDYDKNTEYLAEAFIRFKRELAMTFARSSGGDIVHFPMVESHQENSRCLWVKGPLSHKKIPGFVKSVTSMLNRMDYVGDIAFELFENPSEQFIVNEIAPRVHNSTHYSLNGFNIDQFSLHLKAICGDKLNSPKTGWGGFAMYNLLGTGDSSLALDTQLDVQLHWYGKSKNNLGRKMGHINTQGINPEAALERLKKARKEIKL